MIAEIVSLMFNLSAIVSREFQRYSSAVLPKRYIQAKKMMRVSGMKIRVF